MNPTARSRPPHLLLVVVVLSAITVAGSCARSPADDSAEAGFARDMATHHAQAVEMGFIVRDATEDERLRALSADIIVTQSAQRGMFMAWLQQWGLPQAASGARMAWMGSTGTAGTADSMASMSHTGGTHPSPGMPLMGGMASDSELDALRHARGRDAEVRFLQLMIRHHEGGVLMARALLAQSTRPEVVTIARSIESGQMGEIKTMVDMLRERGAEPYASLLR
jgi:uncharacterized protein (DUF305 family)